MHSIGIDIGGTHLKGAVLELESGTLRHISVRPMPSFRDNQAPGVRALDPQDLLTVVGELLDSLLPAAPSATSLFLCGQMHGLILVDPDGVPAGDLVTWQDSRSSRLLKGQSSSYEGLLAALQPDDSAALGETPQPGYAISVLHHLAGLRHPLKGLAPLGIADWVACRLAGANPVTDLTGAAATGAFDLWRENWHWPWIQRLGLSALAWPELVSSGSPIGQCRRDDRTLQVHAAVGDQQAALLGALLGPDEVSLNIGTGSQVSRLVSGPIPHPGQLRPALTGGLFATLTHLPAGRALTVLYDLVTDLLEEPVDNDFAWRAIEERVAATRPPIPRVDLSFFPCRTGQTGAIHDIEEGHFDVGTLFRGAYEAMARNYAAAIETLGASVPATVVVSGGIVHRSPTFRTMLENLSERPLRLSACPEETLLGLLLLARSQHGLNGSVEEARCWARSRWVN